MKLAFFAVAYYSRESLERISRSNEVPLGSPGSSLALFALRKGLGESSPKAPGWSLASPGKKGAFGRVGGGDLSAEPRP